MSSTYCICRNNNNSRIQIQVFYANCGCTWESSGTFYEDQCQSLAHIHSDYISEMQSLALMRCQLWKSCFIPYPCVVAHSLVTFSGTCPIQFPIVPFLSHFLAKFQQRSERPNLEGAGPHCLGVESPEAEGRESWAPAPLLL